MTIVVDCKQVRPYWITLFYFLWFDLDNFARSANQVVVFKTNRPHDIVQTRVSPNSLLPGCGKTVGRIYWGVIFWGARLDPSVPYNLFFPHWSTSFSFFFFVFFFGARVYNIPAIWNGILGFWNGMECWVFKKVAGIPISVLNSGSPVNSGNSADLWRH